MITVEINIASAIIPKSSMIARLSGNNDDLWESARSVPSRLYPGHWVSG